jgi:hypothetical protein
MVLEGVNVMQEPLSRRRELLDVIGHPAEKRFSGHITVE